MRVAQVTRFGGPEVLQVREVPDPVAGAGQVVIDVSVADTLYVETQIRYGYFREYFSMEPPYVPGGGVGGQVLAVGEGVDAGWIGRSVVAGTGREGGYAEQAVVPVEALIPVPDGLRLPEATSLLHDGVTGLGVFDAAEVKPGEWVLVTAAAGGMGVLLVQLAHAAGAHVAAAARGERKLGLARELGADIAVDYTEPGWDQRVRAATGGAGLDVVLDGAGGQIGLDAFAMTAHGGRISAHGAPNGGFSPIDPAEAERRGVTVRGIQHLQFAPGEARRLAERAVAEVAASRIRPVIGQTFPLDRASDAHAAIESRDVIGKSLLLI
ncbi:zinc-binding dehydrogenase [Sphaerisporangium corydalis]|uniref:Zinc-binding dehydrogenase n=1 Tax=Sphaerisporangium corydalis TaxID=1441875 RepID=A0ABV9EJ87_9ACTN|nr:zinc-binding dehydrogenase [Sphaerisporangium corydalis]